MSIHCPLFFTGKGDKGKSKVGNKKISKDSLIMETLGELDELNSLIGLAKNYLKKYKKDLTEIQNDLFIIQANIAWFMYPKFEKPKLKKERIEKMENEIKRIESKIKPKRSFIIPGSNLESGWFDYLRSKTRTTERKIINFNKKYSLDDKILSYLNRLSSYFFALARFIVYNKKIKERSPWY
ncbi:MAG: ATP:cob(I)alamin adenosyltransferase [Patescibacteria group bacterium]